VQVDRSESHDGESADNRSAKGPSAAEQRQERMASMNWYGMSNSRPNAATTPFTSRYSSVWEMPAGGRIPGPVLEPADIMSSPGRIRTGSNVRRRIRKNFGKHEYGPNYCKFGHVPYVPLQPLISKPFDWLCPSCKIKMSSWAGGGWYLGQDRDTSAAGNCILKLLVLLFIVLLLFSNRLPSVARALGQSVTEFKKGNQRDR